MLGHGSVHAAPQLLQVLPQLLQAPLLDLTALGPLRRSVECEGTDDPFRRTAARTSGHRRTEDQRRTVAPDVRKAFAPLVPMLEPCWGTHVCAVLLARALRCVWTV
ncbi:unnamed protein product [Prorocentrum cordatum]|uniref:Uncharacterized protein n=1 Tax=Prorocentrum cordatum TaxID=2364126 RepID=A0ABN9P666_9DINO|nr:unnamed protein product [Polarella glacialis]